MTFQTSEFVIMGVIFFLLVLVIYTGNLVDRLAVAPSTPSAPVDLPKEAPPKSVFSAFFLMPYELTTAAVFTLDQQRFLTQANAYLSNGVAELLYEGLPVCRPVSLISATESEVRVELSFNDSDESHAAFGKIVRGELAVIVHPQIRIETALSPVRHQLVGVIRFSLMPVSKD